MDSPRQQLPRISKGQGVVGPQPGPQGRFLRDDAAITIYGGAAGGGKTFALLLAPLAFQHTRFDAVVFRRTTPQIMNPGGLWDQACDLYPITGATGRLNRMTWTWSHNLRTTLRVKFAHLEERDSVYNWQGAQVPLICFDELTHFEESQFWYMLSRNRSVTGEPGRVRATTNPDADSWVAKLVDWYIGQDGFPIPERAGVKRWFVRDGDTFIWADSKRDLLSDYSDDAITSFAFHPAKLEDNQLFIDKDPTYKARLNALTHVDRMRLRFGNWRVRFVAGSMFRKDWFETITTMPTVTAGVRYWDRAATKPNPKRQSSDPDWTAGVRLRRTEGGFMVVDDVCRIRETPFGVQRAILNTAKQDGLDVTQVLEQDPGQAGVGEAATLVRMLEGFSVRVVRPTTDKVSRAKPVSAQCEAGNIKLLSGQWNDAFLNELINFPDWPHDDQVDGLSGAFNALVSEARVMV